MKKKNIEIINLNKSEIRNIKYNDNNKLNEKQIIKSQKINDVSLKDLLILNNVINNYIKNNSNNLGMINNDSQNEDIKNIFS